MIIFSLGKNKNFILNLDIKTKYTIKNLKLDLNFGLQLRKIIRILKLQEEIF